MDDYNLWADLLTTYRSNPDWLKGAWLLATAAIPICITAIISFLLYTLFGRQRRRRGSSENAYRTIETLPGPFGDSGLYRVRADDDGVPYLEQVGTVPMLDWDDPDKS